MTRSHGTVSRDSVRVLWPQVWGLALVQGAIALTWVIYNLYLAQLLQAFGLPAVLATTLLVIENILAAVMEPLMGNFSDRVQHQLGTRFPFIALGMIASSLLFLGIPIVLIGVNPVRVLRWLLPMMLVAWAIAMTIFRSPALSLLGRYALRTQQPQAASILTLVGGIAGAMAPLAGNFILGLGPLLAFFIGSLTLLGSAAALQAAGCNQHVVPVIEEVEAITSPVNASAGSDLSQSEPISVHVPAMSEPVAGAIAPATIHVSTQRLALVFGAGFGIALGFRLMMQVFPSVVAQRLPNSNVALVVGSIFIALAITAIPAGSIARWLGMRRAMIVGLGLMATGCGLMVAIASLGFAFALAIALGAAFSLVSNSSLPFALSMVPPEKAGLGTGIYFSGAAVATSLYGLAAGRGVDVSATGGAGGGAIAYGLAAVCVIMSVQVRSRPSQAADASAPADQL